MLDVVQVFKKVFMTAPPKVVRAPTAVPLLGTYASEQNGLSAWVAMDRYVDIAFAPRMDGKVVLTFSRKKTKIEWWISDLDQGSGHPHIDFLKSILFELRKRQVYFSGFNAALSSNVPGQYPWHHMEPFSVAAALAIRELHPYCLTATGVDRPPKRDRAGGLTEMKDVEKIHLTRLLSQAAKNTRQTLVEEQAILCSLTGKPLHVNFMDCLDWSFHLHGMIADLGVVVCPIGRDQSGGPTLETAKRLALCQLAAKKMKVKSLRHVDLKRLMKRHEMLSDAEYRCSYYLLRENIRVLGAEKCLFSHDFPQFGRYMTESFEEQKDFLDYHAPETHRLIALAGERGECLGSRACGAEKRALTVHLVPFTRMKAFAGHLRRQFEVHTGLRIEPQCCRIVRAAGLWDPTWI